LTEAALVQKEKSEWNALIGIFAGAAVNIGEVFTIEEQQPLPNGKSVPLYSAILIDSLLTYDNKECLRIAYTYHSNPENLASLVGITVQNIYESLGKSAESIVISDIVIEGEGERLIDPQTMLIYHEKIKHTTQLQMEVPEMGLVPVIQREEREYEFNY
ncbi:hypothetical protein JW964_04620, partial [candidate division KSB1 bacterium]|nr:hypothetical protein [candidate division KSB1 bacterium]